MEGAGRQACGACEEEVIRTDVGVLFSVAGGDGQQVLRPPARGGGVLEASAGGVERSTGQGAR